MTKVEVLRQIAANLSDKESRGETIVDCLKEIILSLDADADISKCNTIVDCLNTINKIKGSTKVFQTKTDCLKELILTQDSTAKVNNLVTVSDCIGGLATALGSSDNKNGTIADKLLNLKTVIKNEEEPKECQHTRGTFVSVNPDNGNHIIVCEDCHKTVEVPRGSYTPTETPIPHEHTLSEAVESIESLGDGTHRTVYTKTCTGEGCDHSDGYQEITYGESVACSYDEGASDVTDDGKSVTIYTCSACGYKKSIENGSGECAHSHGTLVWSDPFTGLDTIICSDCHKEVQVTPGSYTPVSGE